MSSPVLALYTIGIRLYTLGVRVAALMGHHHARLMVRGWKEWPQRVSRLDAERPTVWFHAASLGEFEQARPVMEAYRRQHPESQLLLTFFSPSGYEVRREYSGADAVCYLPPDLPRQVQRFVQTVRPQAAFFVKYEFWYHHLRALHRMGTPVYFFSVIFRPSQYLFKWYGRWFMRQISTCITHLFVQNEESLQLLRNHGMQHCSVAGDTRYDRVHQIAVEAAPDAVVEHWLACCESDAPVVVAGSTWPPDEQLISQLSRRLRLVLAPHVIAEEHLRQIESLFPRSVRYSQVLASEQPLPCVLIIDNMGLLSRLYRYGTVAYIGGGFGVGIHNTLEAVAFGRPVLFGPNYHKFREACELIECGGGWSHNDLAELQAHLDALLDHTEQWEAASQACIALMEKNIGSTDTILAALER